ncbi:MAG: TonB-dependent receptor [Chitinophagales bacterium]|nr:TonB-dependent receptor [Chitinophagales bacterium]
MNYILIFCFCLLPISLFAQHHYTISGTISDARTGEALCGAVIADTAYRFMAYSNNYGFYSLSIPQRESRHTLSISYVGYAEKRIRNRTHADTILNITLEPRSDTLQSITITSNRTSLQPIGRLYIPMQQINDAPTLGGESDLLKTYTTMPGVSSGVESTTGLLVRGGDTDQNLICLDDAIVYNTAHANGFVSVFNSQAIKSATLIKGGFPARYGGRLSSVLDVVMKEGNRERLSGEFALGTVSSRGIIEGPLWRKKGSFMVSGRISSTALQRLPQRIAFDAGKRSSYDNFSFYDLNVKTNYEFNPQQKLFISFYHGFDNRINQQQEGSNVRYDSHEVKWGNITTTLRYTDSRRKNTFSKYVVYYTKYDYQIGRDGFLNTYVPDSVLSDFSQHSRSTVEDISAQYAVDYMPSNRYYWRMGVELTQHRYTPAQQQGYFRTYEDGISNDTMYNSQSKLSAIEAAVYIENEFRPNNNWNISSGLRYSGFVPQSKYYQSIEPRLSVVWQPKPRWAIKAAYSYMQQYLHTLSNYGLDYPNDIFVPATDRIKPQQAKQYSMGAEYTSPRPNILWSIEAYYKQMSNLITYRDGSNYVFNYNNDWQDLVATNGKGTAYGVELLVQRQVGRLNGWVAYTWSVNNRQFEEINNGKTFPHRYDRRHQLNVSLNWQISRLFSFNVLWIYQTGHAATLAIGRYDVEGLGAVYIFGDRNNYRMPDYHRADASISYHGKSKKRYNAYTITLGGYNVYNRANPHAVSVSLYPIYTVVMQRSLLPFLPYLQFSKKFN